jgi:hypothetical protein
MLLGKALALVLKWVLGRALRLVKGLRLVKAMGLVEV